MFNEQLLVKQENENLQIFDVRINSKQKISRIPFCLMLYDIGGQWHITHILEVHNTKLTEVSKLDFMTPSSFIFLYEK